MRKILAAFLVLASLQIAHAQDVNNPQTNASALTGGTLPAGRMPALTGDCTTSAGAVATTCTKTSGVAFTSAATAAAGQLPGTATNDSATAGNVGQYISSFVLSGSAVALTTGTPLDITTISLTAGDWDVSAMCATQPAAGTTTSVFICSVSPTLNTLVTIPADASAFGLNNTTQPASGGETITTDTARISLSGTTTYHLVAQASFAVSTMGAYGKIRARRVR